METKLLLYKGLEPDQPEKLHSYVVITEEDIKAGKLPEKLNDLERFFSKPLRPARPGTILVTEWPEEHKIRMNTVSYYPQQWPDREQAAAWTIASESIEAQMKLASRAKENPALELLKPLREQYNRMPWSEQPAFLITVIRYITQRKSGRGLSE